MKGEKKEEVTAYSGYRGEDQPRSFVCAGKKIDVVEIVSRCIVEDSASRERRRSFRVKGSDGRIYLLSYHEDADEWRME